MSTRNAQHLDHLHIIGVSHRTAGAQQRQLYSLSNDEQCALLLELKQQTDFSGFIVSTCNRTEVVGLTRRPEAVLALYLSHTKSTGPEFEEVGYQLFAEAALRHLFQVGVGMDSQIPGDFEIIMQLRKGFRRALKMDLTTGFLEKLINQVIHTSKRVKTETAFSTGATSVSYAAARYLKDRFSDLEHTRITLYGLGKFGRITLDHILGLTAPENITLVNRSDDKARRYASEYGTRFCLHSDRQQALNSAHILIVATGADRPILTLNELSNPELHTVIDLAVPFNVDPAVGLREGLTLLNVDELSQMTREALSRRRGELPKAQAIVDEEVQDLLEWHVMRSRSEEITAAIEQLPMANNREALVRDIYPALNVNEPSDEFLQLKMQRYFCHHIRLGQSIGQIHDELIHRLAAIPQQ